MVNIEHTHIIKTKELGIENFSELINTLLTRYIAEAETKDKPPEVESWQSEMAEKKAKSQAAYDIWYAERQREFEATKQAEYKEKIKKYNELLGQGLSIEDARKGADLPCQ